MSMLSKPRWGNLRPIVLAAALVWLAILAPVFACR